MAPVNESRWTRFHWLPALVVVVGVAASFALWGYLVRERREQILETAAEIAAQSRRTVATSVRSHVSALWNLAGFWAAVGRRPVEEWRADAELLIESYPNVDYIAWIYPDGRLSRVAAGKFESHEAVEIVPEDPRRLASKPRLLGPEDDATGNTGFRVVLPVRRGATDLGVLEARVNSVPLLADVLQESAPGYAIQIYWGDELIHSRGEPAPDHQRGWWWQEGPVRLPLDASWRMIHIPTDELAAALLAPTPEYLLAAGILLAIALGVLTHQLRASFLRARFLAEGKEALEVSAEKLRNLNEILERRVLERTKELEAFTHSISHDLKSPLGAILNFAAILELDYCDRLDQDAREMLGRIRASAVRGSELLEGLLRLSRTGHADLETGRIDMVELARESFAQARQFAIDPDVEFVVGPLPNARGDRALIQEVLVNLFDNALKYSRGREKRRVSVRGRVEGDQCVYEVEDNGQGFDMRYAAKLFGLFERLHSSRTIEGTGVGLAMVERIVTRHQGRVWAEGRPGEGARFVFTLPADAPGR